MKMFPCAVSLASSLITLVSPDKISSGDLRQGIIFRATKQNPGSERTESLVAVNEFGRHNPEFDDSPVAACTCGGRAGFAWAEGKKQLQSAPRTVVCGDGGENTYGRSSKQIRGKCHRQILRG